MLKLSQSLLLVALGCVSFGGACSNDDPAPPEDITYSLEISTLDGSKDGPITLRCDLTLAVAVITPSSDDFSMLPANACGELDNCGYLRIEGLDADGVTLARVDTATREGVLVFSRVEDLPRLAQVRASLIRGRDQQPLLNSDGTAVETVESPTFIAPSDCGGTDGGGGAGGEPGGQGGAGGERPGLGGAGGDANPPSTGGAGAGGAPSDAGASSGGAAGAP